ncbi:MAG: 3'(2'),5'-bisphosphate nucleotidase CysQ [Acidimicrobiaceae bacterium]|nr:3'(2'),5'-bisphosphate nucleotidase CysQ [Acidimicrobiaceae bacterium]MYE97202.1 3'(2'),5'-bisphosphate nucleotidase CysQ [Acidimicrobiaceae bacterium]MYI54507.1 3'(2'),5'-bisphosphate nucleotidase CysQ [Acidimicrobiaceae bacterium]
MSPEQLAADDHRLAAQLARRAGELLVELRQRLVSDAPAAVLGAEGDRRAHELLVSELAAARPSDAVLSEEGADDASRLDAERVWVIDPLDGTREFSEPGRTDWAVHVALVVDERPVAGAVSLPGMGLTLSTAEPPELPPERGGPHRLVVSRSRPPEQADTVAAALGADVVPLGSAGAKAMAVVRGTADVYVHAGGQYEWDSCAPAAVAKAAGCFVSRLDGSRLRYNQPDVYLPDLVVCRPELAGPVLAALTTG